ncbi:hypothetical protein CYY_009865 [Polysphondylium violaceum]|uniref:LYR motif-containing protein 7 n=1 Tax=Polysphondylium violaceum TaxID=133409 RepID=A0A8J4PKR2_9MYCE|nr:hypothetical protein CYY_009865 [Polysphondylium violaceum]
MQRAKVIKSYINLLRTEKKVFGNDPNALIHVMNQTRTQYRENKDQQDETKVNELVDHANAVSDFLVKNLLQATRKNEKTFELKFNEHTEYYKQYEFINDQPPARKKRGKIAIPEEESGCCGGGCGKAPSPSSECSK